ncbi:MAG: hypothetical protein GY870_00510, partial [archaeon]|nr:hypothetical protein [archaeon]
MSESDIENINTTSSYKNWKDNYLGIFAFYYFVEGMITAIPFFGFMTYITAMYGEIDLYLWGIIAAVQTLPWTIKFFIGLVNDNFNIKRSRWVVGFGFFGII